jgi:hypothetical protein
LAYDSGSVTTTVANELIFGYGNADSSNTLAGSGFRMRENESNGESEDEIGLTGGRYSRLKRGH